MLGCFVDLEETHKGLDMDRYKKFDGRQFFDGCKE